MAKRYIAKTRIEHGDKDGNASVFLPGDEVPAGMGRALPRLVDVQIIPDAPKVKKPGKKEAGTGS